MFFNFFSNFLYLDTPRNWQFGFQDSATPIAEGLNELNNYINIIIMFVCIFVFWMLFIILDRFIVTAYAEEATQILRWSYIKKPFNISKQYANHIRAGNLSHGVALEIIWTLIPTFILITISIPAFALLYAMDEVIDPQITIKIVGHQWYWSYEYSIGNSDTNETSLDDDIMFDSYMLAGEEAQLRLLDVDNYLVLPINTHIRLIVTASDVLHAWAVPSLGIKIDAVPGRLNQCSLYIKRPGSFAGQCSELCGVNHGFMPIVVRAVSMEEFLVWSTTQKNQ
jgi:cytochrome c oxidase subunit 2